ncbi:hypothetical protein ONZ51_g2020 [Trametes cubensis]|uniref:Glycosyltransferase family 8 protein n=1 Tax=Trametes cubensis TaxID=1111947 RepID=A0AAD7U0C3_9APHY|nr:hypothetical protein ONZ51_g2020 [Trametes cubensis]
MARRAYLTLLTKADYLPGVLVLHRSLVDSGTKYPLIVMTTPALPKEVRDIVERRGLEILEVEPLRPKEGQHALNPHDIRFAETWTKLRMFELLQFDHLVVLDADMVIRRNMDELMDLDLPPGHIAAAHICSCNPRKLAHYPKDWTPENCPHTGMKHPEALTSPRRIEPSSPRPHTLLNGGLVILRPSLDIYRELRQFLAESPLVPTFSFPDQDLMSIYFKDRWQPLPWCYNALKPLRWVHPDEWRDEEVRCVHYILSDKPWMVRPGTGDPNFFVVNQWWWDVFEKLRVEMGASDPEGWKLVESVVAESIERFEKQK